GRRGAAPGAGAARHREVDARPGRGGGTGGRPRAAYPGGDGRVVQAPQARMGRSAAELGGQLRGLPGGRHDLGAPADVPEVRERRLLRLVAAAPRVPALPRDTAPGHAQFRAWRDLALVFRRQAAWLVSTA